MSAELPSLQDIDETIASVNAIIGIGAAFRASRFQFQADSQQRAEYSRLYKRLTQQLRRLAEAGFYVPHLNENQSLDGLWGWAITSITGSGNWGQRRDNVAKLYDGTVAELRALREVVGAGADAQGEVLRELRESRRRADELFVIMADHAETRLFLDGAVRPAAESVGLRPVFMSREDPEEAISEAILSAIRRSVLVVADLTFARPNCYYEAGYARGAFRRVLLTCRKDHDPRSGGAHTFKVHFDVDQNRITWWMPDAFAAAVRELQDRLRQAKRELGLA